ncbi:MAG: hypothetical protein ABIO81_09025 [Ginsengibacter sp.]
MTEELRLIFDWSEVWALLIPIFQLLLKPKQPGYLRPVIFYLWAALLLNLLVDVLGEYNKFHRGTDSISNNPLYNMHSLIRFACFSYFFILLRQAFFNKMKIIIPLLFILFLLLNFGFFNENFFLRDHISGNLFSAEAFLLLVYCMLFYLSKLRDEVEIFRSGKDFWIVTGLSIYVVSNFFVFLFYVPMITENSQLANNMWDVHNVAYIILCIFISKAFYVPAAN